MTTETTKGAVVIETDPEVWASYMLEKGLVDGFTFDRRNEEGDELVHVIRTIQEGSADAVRREKNGIYSAEERGYEIGVDAAVKAIEVRFASYFGKMTNVNGLLTEHEKSVIFAAGEAQAAIRKLKVRNDR